MHVQTHWCVTLFTPTRPDDLFVILTTGFGVSPITNPHKLMRGTSCHGSDATNVLKV